MFGLMKNVTKEAAAPSGPMTLAELHAGCVLGFGFMPQKNVSGKRIPVAEVNSYLFASDSFVAYRLVSDSTDISLIVADEDDPSGTYLALSQRLEPRLFDSVFAKHGPQYWFALKEGETVTVNPPALGAAQGWMTERYTLAVAASGRFLEGDWRLRKATERTRLSRAFEYVLLVDEENEFALEAEKYEDGTLAVFATIYRPATDIGEIVRAPKSPSSAYEENYAELPRSASPEARTEATESLRPLVLVGPVETIPHVSPLENAKPKQEQKIPAPANPKIEDTQADQQAVAEPQPEPITAAPELKVDEAETGEGKTDEAETMPQAKQEALDEAELSAMAEEIKAPEAEAAPSAAEEPQQGAPEISVALAATAEAAMTAAGPEPEASAAIHSKFGRIQPAASLPMGDTLVCEARLAARLIDEAQRNEMALSELIRKVIDLPARVQDQVFIPFTLDPSESADLARRYQLSAGDTQGVKRQIVEELKRFAGEKV